jgi:hypothetical protein
MLKIPIILKHITNKVDGIYIIFLNKTNGQSYKKVNGDKYFDTEGVEKKNNLYFALWSHSKPVTWLKAF